MSADAQSALIALIGHPQALDCDLDLYFRQTIRSTNAPHEKGPNESLRPTLRQPGKGGANPG